jgi:hypothetical protein
MNSRYRLLIHWDGTLMDSAEKSCAVCARCRLRAASPKNGHQVIGLGLKEAVAVSDVPRVTPEWRTVTANIIWTTLPCVVSACAALFDLRAEGYLLAGDRVRRGLIVFEETGVCSLFIASRCADETRRSPIQCCTKFRKHRFPQRRR